MLATTIAATVVAAVSAVIAFFAFRQARQSAVEAKRSADAAEQAAGAAAITAEADRAENHRQRQPRLLVIVDQLASHDGTEAIYRVINEGPADLDSVVVHRPILGPVEGRINHPVSAIGMNYGPEAEIGPIPMGTYGRFTLSLGSGSTLPEFRVKIVTWVGDEDWLEVKVLDYPRQPPPPRIVKARMG